MRPYHPILSFLLSTYLFFSPASSQISATVSIYNDPTFKSQRLCAIECILCGYGTYGQHDCIGMTLSCSSPLENECYCRADLQPAAVSYVASCVSSACSNTNDVATAVGIYTQYCETADQTSVFVPPSTTQVTTPTATLITTSKGVTTTLSISVVSSTVTAANGQPSTVLITVTPTAGSSGTQTTSSNANSSSSSKNPNLGPIIGGAIGGVLILGIAAVIITWLILREQRKQRPTDIMGPLPPVSVNSLPTSPPPGYMSPKPHRRSA